MGILQFLGMSKTIETPQGPTINRIDGIDDNGSTRDTQASREYGEQRAREGKTGYNSENDNEGGEFYTSDSDYSAGSSDGDFY